MRCSECSDILQLALLGWRIAVRWCDEVYRGLGAVRCLYLHAEPQTERFPVHVLGTAHLSCSNSGSDVREKGRGVWCAVVCRGVGVVGCLICLRWS